MKIRAASSESPPKKPEKAHERSCCPDGEKK
jgi:hypothetical protein